MTQETIAFDSDYMKHRMHIAWRGPIIARAIVEVLNPETALDLGCGTGDIAAGLLGEGVDAWGVDNSSAAGGCLPSCGSRMVYSNILGVGEFLRRGRTSEHRIELPVDLVILLEVLAVSLEADRKAILAEALGLGHIVLLNGANALMAPHLEHWRYDTRATEALREKLRPWGHKQAVKALYQTGQIWRR
jgi:hypothetical protein